MIQLTIQAAQNKAQMFIDFCENNIDFTIISNDQQFDFTIDKDEWTQLKIFIDGKIESENNIQKIK